MYFYLFHLNNTLITVKLEVPTWKYHHYIIQEPITLI